MEEEDPIDIVQTTMRVSINKLCVC